MIEILSPSSLSHDQLRKLNLYEHHRVPEYWVINPDGIVMIFRLQRDHRYGRPDIYNEQMQLETPLFPRLKIDLKEVFPPLPANGVRERPGRYDAIPIREMIDGRPLRDSLPSHVCGRLTQVNHPMNSQTHGPSNQALQKQLQKILESFPVVRIAFLFGSLMRGTAHFSSDLDLGVAGNRTLTTTERYDLTTALALAVQRPIDLIDLREAGPVILRSALHGHRIWMSDQLLYAFLIIRSVTLAADFEPCRQTILTLRRKAWIGA